MKGEHFIIDNTWEVPNFLDEVMATFGEEEYEAHVLDIEGCFPSMPKEKIRFAMMQLVQEARQEGHQGVSVPTRSKKLKCSWRKVGGNFKWLPFEDMLKALDFSLENAVSIRKDGGVIIQKVGIRMGDALSPAMTIGTCGWMEREFMQGLHKDTKNNFKAKRYMDDVLLFMKKEGWDATRWLELRRLPPNSAPDSGVIFHAAAGVGPPRTDIRKSEEKLHLKDSHQTRTGRAQRGPLDGMLS